MRKHAVGKTVNNKKTNNLLFVNSIGQNGSIEQNAVEKENNNYSQILSGNIGKYFREIKTSFAISGSVFEQKGYQIINNQLSEVTSRSINPSFRISSSPLEWFGFEYNYNLSNIKNSIDDVPKPIIIQQSHSIRINLNPKSDWYFGVITDFYFNNFNETKNLFSDLIFQDSFLINL